MLYGKYPYKPQNNSLHALLTLIDQNRKEPPFVLGVKVSEEAKDLMRQMLQVDERQRIDFPKLMGHSWIEKKLDAEAIKNRYR
jgi:serine/threonine protein kinase